jgi:hypothetical protein
LAAHVDKIEPVPKNEFQLKTFIVCTNVS